MGTVEIFDDTLPEVERAAAAREEKRAAIVGRIRDASDPVLVTAAICVVTGFYPLVPERLTYAQLVRVAALLGVEVK